MPWKQTSRLINICYKNQERLILAMNLGMRLIGWSGDFYGWRIFAVSLGLMKLIDAGMLSFNWYLLR